MLNGGNILNPVSSGKRERLSKLRNYYLVLVTILAGAPRPQFAKGEWGPSKSHHPNPASKYIDENLNPDYEYNMKIVFRYFNDISVIWLKKKV